jgi:hypothetical protein
VSEASFTGVYAGKSAMPIIGDNLGKLSKFCGVLLQISNTVKFVNLYGGQASHATPIGAA